jgi:hypothetical protein
MSSPSTGRPGQVVLDDQSARLGERENPLPGVWLCSYATVGEDEAERSAAVQLLERVPLQELDVVESGEPLPRARNTFGSRSTVTTLRAVSARTAAVSP